MNLRTKSVFLFMLMEDREVFGDHSLQPRGKAGSGLTHPLVYTKIPAFSVGFHSALENQISRVLVSNEKFSLWKDFLDWTPRNKDASFFPPHQHLFL